MDKLNNCFCLTLLSAPPEWASVVLGAGHVTASTGGVPLGSVPTPLLLWGLRSRSDTVTFASGVTGPLAGCWDLGPAHGRTDSRLVGDSGPSSFHSGELNLSHAGGLEPERGPSEEDPHPAPWFLLFSGFRLVPRPRLKANTRLVNVFLFF